MPSDRNSFAADEIRWAFIKYVPINAIEYFILQANRSELRWPITIMLHGIDHPSAVFHIAHVLAEIQTELEGTDSFSPFASMAGDDWRRQQEDHGISMSTESKNELFNLWSNQELDKHLRKESFKLWSASHNKNDIAILKSFKKDAVLHDLVLKQRVILGDIKALPQLVKKIKTLMTSDYWWQFTRNIWSKELTTTLDYELNKRSKQVSKNWSQIPFRSDWITSKLIMRLPTVVAESMLVKHWEHAKYSSYFVKTALYIATDKLVDLVSIIISNCPKSKKMFEHLSMHFGVKTRKHPGVTKKRQLEVLIPYLDFMEEHDLYSFWELCNENGWFDFRKKHLDQRLQTSTYIYLEYLSPDRAIQSLNDMIEQKQEIWINHWVDNFLKTGMSVEGIITTIFNWIKSQDKIGFKAIKLSLDVILYIGNRNHYYELLKICSPVKNEYIDYFTNAFFLLRSRQLN